MDEHDKVQLHLFRWSIRFCMPVLTCRDLGPSISSEYFQVILQTLGNIHSYRGDRPWCKIQNYFIPNNGEMTPSWWLIHLWLVNVFLIILHGIFSLVPLWPEVQKMAGDWVWTCYSNRNHFLLVSLLWTVESLPSFCVPKENAQTAVIQTRVGSQLSLRPVYKSQEGFGKLTFCLLKPRWFLLYKSSVSGG